MRHYFVIDVESLGLYGDGFAVGWVVVRGGSDGSPYTDWSIVDEGRMATPAGQGYAHSDEDRRWVIRNVPPLPFTHETLAELRTAFWREWERWRERCNGVMWADCGYPVETTFLEACVENYPSRRVWNGPYPLHEIATVRLLAGLDPTAKVDRQDREMPIHDPLADARQSARLLMEALELLEEQRKDAQGALDDSLSFDASMA